MGSFCYCRIPLMIAATDAGYVSAIAAEKQALLLPI
jgi:hypothetical protein